MGIVTKVHLNSINEVTDVEIRKGNREIVKRHVKSLILLIKNGITCSEDSGEYRTNPVVELSK